MTFHLTRVALFASRLCWTSSCLLIRLLRLLSCCKLPHRHGWRTQSCQWKHQKSWSNPDFRVNTSALRSTGWTLSFGRLSPPAWSMNTFSPASISSSWFSESARLLEAPVQRLCSLEEARISIFQGLARATGWYGSAALVQLAFALRNHCEIMIHWCQDPQSQIGRGSD